MYNKRAYLIKLTDQWLEKLIFRNKLLTEAAHHHKLKPNRYTGVKIVIISTSVIGIVAL
jgi:hypothetical protein